MKTISALLSVMALLTLPTLAQAQGWEIGIPHGMGYGPSWMGEYASGLSLSNEQIQKLEALHERFLKETASMRNDLVVKEVELRTLWLRMNPEEGKILAKEKEMNALRAQIQEKGTKYLLEGWKIFTPEQQVKVITSMNGGFSHHKMEWMDGYSPWG